MSVAVRWSPRYGLSYRDVEELLAVRGIAVDHVTAYRWVQTLAPEFIAARSYDKRLAELARPAVLINTDPPPAEIRERRHRQLRERPQIYAAATTNSPLTCRP
jgi:hypothetical protein